MATLKDIAERVGVSTCTVSRYINRKITVREETARKIDQAIKELDYRKNYMAVSLKTQSSKTVAVVIPALKNIFFADIAENVARVLEDNQYSMVTFTTDNDFTKEVNVAERLREVGIAGAIFMTLPVGYNGDDHIRRLETNGILTLMINRFFSPNEFTNVSTDFRTAVEKAVDRLAKSGRENIGLIAGWKDQPQSHEYVAGFRKALRKQGKKLDLDNVSYCMYDVQKMFKPVDDLMHQKVDAIVCISDYILLEVRSYLRKRGIRVPEDIMLVGSGNTEFTGLVGLPSIDSKTEELGKIGAQNLLKRLNEEPHDKFTLIKPDVEFRGCLS